jgi:hypothetical protein
MDDAMTNVTMTNVNATDMTDQKMTAPTLKDNRNRHAKMFDLLLGCDIEGSGLAPTRSIPSKTRARDERATIAADQVASVSARYLDANTADQMIARGVSSFDAPRWLGRSRAKAAKRAAQFLARQINVSGFRPVCQSATA